MKWPVEHAIDIYFENKYEKIVHHTYYHGPIEITSTQVKKILSSMLYYWSEGKCSTLLENGKVEHFSLSNNLKQNLNCYIISTRSNVYLMSFYD